MAAVLWGLCGSGTRPAQLLTHQKVMGLNPGCLLALPMPPRVSLEEQCRLSSST